MPPTVLHTFSFLSLKKDGGDQRFDSLPVRNKTKLNSLHLSGCVAASEPVHLFTEPTEEPSASIAMRRPSLPRALVAHGHPPARGLNASPTSAAATRPARDFYCFMKWTLMNPFSVVQLLAVFRGPF